MSDYEQLQRTVNILTAFEAVFLAVAAICLIIAAVLFIKFKIPGVISEISGKKKQRQLEQMRMNKQPDSKNDFEVKHEAVQDNTPQQRRSDKRNATVQKDDVKSPKKHETTFADNKRQTAVMDKGTSENSKKKQHNTTVMEKKKSAVRKYDALDETVILHSDEIIE